MFQSKIVDIETPEHVLLSGIWLGKEKTNTCYIFIHGLGGNVFSNRELARFLVSDSSSVLMFNNRGHDLISRVKMRDPNDKTKTISFTGGAAHEVFSECVDDIEGAVHYAKSKGAKKIILVGHSTGSQKAIYYAAQKNNQKKLAGIVLLSPLSDFAGIMKQLSVEDYKNILKIAEALIMQGQEHQLLPTTIWPSLADAQRFVSLATPMSEEEIFSYFDQSKKTIYSEITIPLLVVLGKLDEYRDRPISKIAKWFDTHHQSEQYLSKILPKGTHGFDDTKHEVAKIVKQFVT